MCKLKIQNSEAQASLVNFLIVFQEIGFLIMHKSKNLPVFNIRLSGCHACGIGSSPYPAEKLVCL